MSGELLAVQSYGETIQINRKTGLSQHARLTRDLLSVEYSEPPTLHEWAWDFQRSVIDLWEIRMWRLGYMLLTGEQLFGEDHACVLDPHQFHEVTYRKARYVCSRFPRHRVRPNLSFSHHEAVAKLPVEEQDMWLDRAEAEGWSRDELRRRVREAYNPAPLKQPDWSSADQSITSLAAHEGRLDNLPEDSPTVIYRQGNPIGIFVPLALWKDGVVPALQDNANDVSSQEGPDHLETAWAEVDERDSWPLISVRVPPETKALWDSLIGRTGIEDEAEATRVILAAVNITTLRPAAPD